MSALGCVLAAASILISVYLFSKINDERERNVRVNCEQTNARHDATIHQLDALIRQRAETATPRERERIDQSRASTVLLIDALTPKRDCDRLVRGQISSRP